MEEFERSFRGIWIPAEVWLSQDLTLQEKVFIVEIDSLDNHEGCFATNHYFSEFFGISKTRVSQIINGLEKKGYLRIRIEKEGRQVIRRIINICRPPYPGYLENCNTPLEKCNTLLKDSKGGYLENCNTPLEKCKGNNIINNTINNNIDNIYAPAAHKEKSSHFIKPTLEQAKAYSEDYAKEHNQSKIDIEKWFDFYESKGWMIGKNHMKDWKAAVRTWYRSRGQFGNNGGYSKPATTQKFKPENRDLSFLEQ